MLAENVVQPLLVSTSAISLSTETVCSIMKIDDVVCTGPFTMPRLPRLDLDWIWMPPPSRVRPGHLLGQASLLDLDLFSRCWRVTLKGGELVVWICHAPRWCVNVTSKRSPIHPSLQFAADDTIRAPANRAALVDFIYSI
jgi:hypothetical protein